MGPGTHANRVFTGPVCEVSVIYLVRPNNTDATITTTAFCVCRSAHSDLTFTHTCLTSHPLLRQADTASITSKAHALEKTLLAASASREEEDGVAPAPRRRSLVREEQEEK
eukprot:1297392-Rhodomonas_salina.1